MKLKQLKTGDKFSFVNQQNKKYPTWIVEGQYPNKGKTTIYSEKMASGKAEPILVENWHEVRLIQKKSYKISHNVKLNK